jgi:nicotinamidase-related amidase
MTTILLILCGSIITVAVAAALFMYRSMFVATRGRKIAAYPQPRAALVVLDLQEGYSGSGARQPVTQVREGSIFASINHLIDGAAATGMEVAYIRQVFSNNLFVRMHGGRRIGKVMVDRRIKLINNNDFAKNRTDAFSSYDFEQLLINRQVNELYLTGVDASYCVYYTAIGALNRGYRVTVVVDAVASRTPMATVLERYGRAGIAVITSAELLTRRMAIVPEP